MGVATDVVNIDDIAAVTFEETVIERQCIFVGIERLHGLYCPVTLQKEDHMLQLRFHVLNVGKQDPMGSLDALYNDAFGGPVHLADQLVQTGE